MDNVTLTVCRNESLSGGAVPQDAGALYYGMVAPFANYSVAGWVWYQVRVRGACARYARARTHIRNVPLVLPRVCCCRPPGDVGHCSALVGHCQGGGFRATVLGGFGTAEHDLLTNLSKMNMCKLKPISCVTQHLGKLVQHANRMSEPHCNNSYSHTCTICV